MPTTLPSSVPRCVWCNSADGVLIELRTSASRFAETARVHPEHRDEARKWLEFAERSETRFLVLFLSFLVIGVPVVTIATARGTNASLIGAGGVLAYLGFVTFKYPFATPQTVASWGMRRAVQVARAIGIALLAGGAAMVLLGVIRYL